MAPPTKKEGGGKDDTLRTMLASAMAGTISRIPMHPIDTCKAKMQVQTSSGVYKNFVDCLRQTFRTEGIRGLYRGFGIAFVGSAPASCLYWTSYETSKKLLSSSSALSNHTFASHFMSGLMAESLSCVLWVPIDVIKERLQVQSNIGQTAAASASASATATATQTLTHSQHPHAGLRYRGSLDAIVQISRNEGLRGIYKGYFATVASFGPFSAIYLATYEQLKLLSMRMLRTDESKLPFSASLLNGCAAGSVASVMTNALDMSKLRLQVQRGNRAFSFGYSNIFHGVWQIAKTEGFRGLFKGAGARVAFHAPSTAITIAILEECKKFLNRFDRFKH